MDNNYKWNTRELALSDIQREFREDSSRVSNANLLALVVGTKKAEEVYNALLETPDMSAEELRAKTKITASQSMAVLAGMELGKRLHARDPRRTIQCPRDIYREVQHYAYDATQERLVVVMLNGAHEVIGTFTATAGLVNKTLVHPREVFAPAIEKRAAAICIAHNHPSGHPEPSEDDMEATKRIKEAGRLLGISVLDHLIFTENSYYSLMEHGQI